MPTEYSVSPLYTQHRLPRYGFCAGRLWAGGRAHPKQLISLTPTDDFWSSVNLTCIFCGLWEENTVPGITHTAMGWGSWNFKQELTSSEATVQTTTLHHTENIHIYRTEGMNINAMLKSERPSDSIVHQIRLNFCHFASAFPVLPVLLWWKLCSW